VSRDVTAEKGLSVFGDMIKETSALRLLVFNTTVVTMPLGTHQNNVQIPMHHANLNCS
jgi:hypothetical protein